MEASTSAAVYATKESFDNFIKNSQQVPYTWVYRWNADNEFTWQESPNIHKAVETIHYTPSPQAQYFMNIISKHPSIVIYHKNGQSKVKHCRDKKHFHVISFHKEHPSNIHSFQMFKNILKNNIANPYTMSAIKVFTPFGFCKYLTQDDTMRWVICADNLHSKQQNAMLKQLTDKEYSENEDSDTDCQTNTNCKR